MNEARTATHRATANALRRLIMSLLTAAATVLVTLMAASSPASAQESSGEKAADEYQTGELEMVEAINGYREDNGLSRLEVADTASKAAERHSEDMATHDFFDHDTMKSDHYGSGASFADRLSREGYDYNTYRSENIAAGHESVGDTLEQWKNSSGHNENMLNPELEVIGIGKVCSETSEHGCYWTTDFGAHTPESARAVDEIESSLEQKTDSGQNESSTSTPEDESEEGEPAGESDSKVTGESSSTSTGSGNSNNSGNSAGSNATTDSEPNQKQSDKEQSGSNSGTGQTISQSTTQSITQTNGQSTSGSEGSGNGSTQSQHSVQITENGKTTTLTGDEAEKEICEQFGQAREEAISGLREDASGEDQDQAAEIKNEIADDFEQSLLNPDSCKNNEAKVGQSGPAGSSDKHRTAKDDPDTPETPGSGSSRTTPPQEHVEQPDPSSTNDQYADDDRGGSDEAPGNGSSDNQSDKGDEGSQGSKGSGDSTDSEGGDYDATATVSRAVDGDTLALEEPVEGKDRVRLIGVDTPEVAQEDGEQDEPYGEKASKFTSEELEGEKVGLVFGQDKEDDYDRLLAYVYTIDEPAVNNDQPGKDSGSGKEDQKGSMFNEALLRQGYAEVLTVEPNSKYEKRFEQAEEKAREQNRGIWSEDSEDSELGERTTGEDSTAQEDTSKEPKEDTSLHETSSGKNGPGEDAADGDETNMETMGDAGNEAGYHDGDSAASSEDSDEANDSGDSQNRGGSEAAGNEGDQGDESNGTNGGDESESGQSSESSESSESGQAKASNKADDSGGNDSKEGDEDKEDEGGLKALIMFWE